MINGSISAMIDAKRSELTARIKGTVLEDPNSTDEERINRTVNVMAECKGEAVVQVNNTLAISQDISATSEEFNGISQNVYQLAQKLEDIVEKLGAKLSYIN